jgi:type I restriction enzyme S subunit
MATNQGFLNFRCGKKLLPEFLYYWLKANRNYLDVVANGSVYPELFSSDLFEFEIAVPSISEQAEIVCILGSVDNKIDSLRENNRTLELIAKALFKSWFMDFDFPNNEGKPYRSCGGYMIDTDSELGQIPKGWEMTDLANACQLITDGSHNSPKEDLTGKKRIATIANMGEYGFDFDSCKRISDNDYDLLKRNGCTLEKGDVLFSKDGTVGITFVYEDDKELAVLSSIAILKAGDVVSPYFLKCFLDNERTKDILLSGYRSGSVLMRVVIRDLKQLRIIVPPKPLMDTFTAYVQPIYGLIHHNLKQIEILKDIRNTFLPKIISGKIRLGSWTDTIK